MGLGPSIKMTTLHHYNCPVTRRLLSDPDVDFAGVLLDGVSENYTEKVRTAEQTGEMAAELRADGAIVAIDGWGNHHIDFTEVIRSLGEHDIPSVGISYIGRQGRLVCTNPYVGTIIDFNKEASGYETCCVGENNLTDDDAMKAVGVLKHQVKLANPGRFRNPARDSETADPDTLTRIYLPIHQVQFGSKTELLPDGTLILRRDIGQEYIAGNLRIRELHIDVIPPEKHDIFVNSNLDIEPIAVKCNSELGSGCTLELSGIRAMLNGVEEGSGFQPANIGSSEGILADRVYFDRAGTPGKKDQILHLDFLFQNGEGRTAEGIEEAHIIADHVLQEIREAMWETYDSHAGRNYPSENILWRRHPGAMRLILVKISSGLGNMYDTVIFPDQPGGILGSRAEQMRIRENNPVYFTPLQVMDGVIHTLL